MSTRYVFVTYETLHRKACFTSEVSGYNPATLVDHLLAAIRKMPGNDGEIVITCLYVLPEATP